MRQEWGTASSGALILPFLPEIEVFEFPQSDVFHVYRSAAWETLGLSFVLSEGARSSHGGAGSSESLEVLQEDWNV